MSGPEGVLTAEAPPELHVLGTIERAPSGLNTVDQLQVSNLEPGNEPWTELLPPSCRPRLRSGAGVGYDAAQNRLFLSGGLDNLLPRVDLWRLILP